MVGDHNIIMDVLQNKFEIKPLIRVLSLTSIILSC